jgi:hypothetical protein
MFVCIYETHNIYMYVYQEEPWLADVAHMMENQGVSEHVINDTVRK